MPQLFEQVSAQPKLNKIGLSFHLGCFALLKVKKKGCFLNGCKHDHIYDNNIQLVRKEMKLLR